MKRSPLELKLTYKALGFIVDDSETILDIALQSEPDLLVKHHFKNVCAMISEPLTKRLEDTLSLLKITKREFIELAIIEALNQADVIMDECGVTDYLEDLARHQAKEREAA